MPGSHWLSIYKDNNTVYVYDSFARPTKILLPVLYGQIQKLQLDTIMSKTDIDQYPLDSEICGPLSLAWCELCEMKGIKTALYI